MTRTATSSQPGARQLTSGGLRRGASSWQQPPKQMSKLQPPFSACSSWGPGQGGAGSCEQVNGLISITAHINNMGSSCKTQHTHELPAQFSTYQTSTNHCGQDTHWTLVLSSKSCEGDTAPRDNWLERAQPTKLALGELVGICPTLGALLSEVGLLLSSFINSAAYGKGREKKA
jgi:hypothetical protein